MINITNEFTGLHALLNLSVLLTHCSFQWQGCKCSLNYGLAYQCHHALHTWCSFHEEVTCESQFEKHCVVYSSIMCNKMIRKAVTIRMALCVFVFLGVILQLYTYVRLIWAGVWDTTQKLFRPTDISRHWVCMI